MKDQNEGAVISRTDISLSDVDAAPKPSQYLIAADGELIQPGRYGRGIGGESIVCLLGDDTGEWFKQILPLDKLT